MESLGDSLVRMDRFREAKPLLEAALKGQEKKLPWNNYKMGFLKWQLGECEMAEGVPIIAEGMFRDSVKILEQFSRHPLENSLPPKVVWGRVLLPN